MVDIEVIKMCFDSTSPFTKRGTKTIFNSGSGGINKELLPTLYTIINHYLLVDLFLKDLRIL